MHRDGEWRGTPIVSSLLRPERSTVISQVGACGKFNKEVWSRSFLCPTRFFSGARGPQKMYVPTQAGREGCTPAVLSDTFNSGKCSKVLLSQLTSIYECPRWTKPCARCPVPRITKVATVSTPRCVLSVGCTREKTGV